MGSDYTRGNQESERLRSNPKCHTVVKWKIACFHICFLSNAAWCIQWYMCACKVASVMSDSGTYGLQPTRLLCPWDSPGNNIGVVAMRSSRGFSWLRDRTRVSCISSIAGRFFTATGGATGEAPIQWYKIVQINFFNVVLVAALFRIAILMLLIRTCDSTYLLLKMVWSVSVIIFFISGCPICFFFKYL